jgi:hypothetical protein
MIDLCKVFGVEEGEEFKLGEKRSLKYRIYNGELNCTYIDCENDWSKSHLELNEINGCKIIKLPKKKEFTDDELAIMRSIDKDYKWITRDDYNGLAISNEDKPQKTKIEGIRCWYSVGMVTFMFEHLFQSIQWEDEEPVFIDDYVERGAENE